MNNQNMWSLKILVPPYPVENLENKRVNFQN